MIAAGLDGYRSGWVAVFIDTAKSTQELRFLQTLDELNALQFDRAAIDIPIGLDEAPMRACDRLARQMLGKHASRVFTGARRSLLKAYGPSLAAHARINRRLKTSGQPGVSLQLWHILPKIAEADRAMANGLKRKAVEAHPELVFWRLNNKRDVPSKKTPEGTAIRKRLLVRAGFSRTALNRWLTRERIGTGAKVDDILDACACAIAARDRTHAVPSGSPKRDATGLAMQIWY